MPETQLPTLGRSKGSCATALIQKKTCAAVHALPCSAWAGLGRKSLPPSASLPAGFLPAGKESLAQQSWQLCTGFQAAREEGKFEHGCRQASFLQSEL